MIQIHFFTDDTFTKCVDKITCDNWLDATDYVHDMIERGYYFRIYNSKGVTNVK